MNINEVVRVLSLPSKLCRNVVTAMWYLSQALGTLLNAGVAQISQINLLIQFLLYMALLFLVTIIFIIVNRHFKYADNSLKQNVH